MPKQYPAELRRQTCDRILAGEAVKDLSAELGIAGVTLYKWRRQALIDAGQRPRPEELRTRSAGGRPPAGQRARGRAQSGQGGQRPVRGGRRRTEKEVRGCPRAEQPGPLRALRLSDRRPRLIDLLRLRWSRSGARCRSNSLNRQKWRTNLELAVAMADGIDHFYIVTAGTARSAISRQTNSKLRAQHPPNRPPRPKKWSTEWGLAQVVGATGLEPVISAV